jgi:GNAT superfamily N-acetyltransferase
MFAPQPSQDTFVITQAGYKDIPSLVPVWLEMMRFHAGLNPAFSLHAEATEQWVHMMCSWVRRHDACVWMAGYRGEKIGFVSGCVLVNAPVYAVSEVGFLSEMAVVPSMQRKGVGRALLRCLKTWCAQQGVQEMQLSTAVQNTVARAFWEAEGGLPSLVRYSFKVC